MKSDTMIMRINPNLKQRLKEEAERDSKSMAEWVTDLIKIEIAKREENR